MHPQTKQFNKDMEHLVKKLQLAEHLHATTTNPRDPQLLQQLQEIHAQLTTLKHYATHVGLASKMGAILKALTRRWNALEYLPPQVLKAQIQSLLAFPNLRFMEGDLAYDEQTNELTASRFVVLDGNGLVCFDETFASYETTMPINWSHLEQTLAGTYTMSYDYDFLLEVLALTATCHPGIQLDVPALVGGSVEMLFEQLTKGGQLQAMEPVLQEDALGRAQGILHLLKEIANETF